MTAHSFVHLHLHSEYSILDGMCRLDRLVEEVARRKMPAVAVTDHGNLYGALDFYQKARKAGVHPIIGCELYVAVGSRFEKSKKKNGVEDGKKSRHCHHLTVLCKDNEGYKNLLKLCTAGFNEGFYYYPRVDKDLLREHSKGLIAFSGCLAGEVCSNLIQDDYEHAEQTIRAYVDIFGDNNFYLEIMPNDLPEQNKANQGIVDLSRRLGLPMIVTNDAHYILPTDANAHRVMVCIQTGTRLDDPDALSFETDQFYLKSPEEMWSQMGEYAEALKNTVEIAQRCQVDIKFSEGKLNMPKFKAPNGLTPDQFLRELVYQGAWKRYFPYAGQEDWDPANTDYQTLAPTGIPPTAPAKGKDILNYLPKVVRERIEYELGIIETKGFVGYFLIVWDFINYAREKGIGVGPGRGSVVGSIVAYCLRITNLDPLLTGLIFERFQNLERESPPDIDTDFSDRRRDEVIHYVAERYGAESVAQIATFSRMGAKQVVRDVARVMGMSAKDGNEIATRIPDDLKINLQTALEKSPELRAIRHQNPDYEKLFDTAFLIEGTIRQTSVHAAGIIIGPESLINFCPLMKTNNGETCSQFEHKHLEALGLVKMDFLGLKTLSVLEDTLNNLKKRGIEIDIDVIPINDPKTYELLQKGSTNGIFQLESSGMKDLIKRLRPDGFHDVIPLLALYRPGPLQSGMVDRFINCKHGHEKIVYDHPDLEPILKETYGTILYQEQVMQIANRIAGYTLGEADVLRAAMGKKKPEILAAQKSKFIKGAVDKGYDEKFATQLFDTIEKFAGYGFNKSHSAAYAFIAYQTAYLKANYPKEFMAALLTNDRNNTSKVVRYVNDCRDMQIPVLPPDINLSEENFTVSSLGILFGLGGIKGMGEAAISSIIKEREANGPFKSLSDLCERIDSSVVNSRILECLIRSGALDCFGKKRSQLLHVLPEAIQSASYVQNDRAVGQGSLLDMFADDTHEEHDLIYPDVPDLTRAETLEGEKSTLGFYVTGHPLTDYEKQMKLLASHTAAQIAELEKDKTLEVRLVGIISSVSKKRQKSGDLWAIVRAEDLTGEFGITLFPRQYANCSHLVHEGSIVVVEGTARQGAEIVEVIAESLKSFDNAWKENVKCVHVDITSEGLDKNLVDSLRRAFRQHPGKSETYLHIQTPRHGEVVMRAGDEYMVTPSQEFVYQIEDLLKPDSITFEVAGIRPKEPRENGERWHSRNRQGNGSGQRQGWSSNSQNN